MESDLIIVIISVVLSLVAFFILQWIVYPFILRYKIDTINEELEVTQNINGSNGINGINGANSPDTKNGSHGTPGESSSSGVNGNNGVYGVKGNTGHLGIRGLAGNDGSNGSQGILGFNAIPVKNDIFNTNGKVTYYIDGKSLDKFLISKKDEKASIITSEKERIINRIDRILINTSDKLAFRNLLDNVDINLTTPNPSLIILDTYDKFDLFLDSINSTITSEHNIYKNIVTSKSLLISAAKANISSLRNTRKIDLSNFELDPVILSGRNIIYTNHLSSISSYSSDTDFTNDINNWKTNITSTINNIIINIKLRKVSENNIYTSSLSTVSQKNLASDQITIYNNQINLLNTIKDELVYFIQTEKNKILESYDMGGIPSMSISGAVFSNYNAGANFEKNIITTSSLDISQGEIVMNNNIDSSIQVYRTANGI